MRWPSISVGVSLASCGRCGRSVDLTQVCAVCGERLCSDCYGRWGALACVRCRAWARMVIQDPAS